MRLFHRQFTLFALLVALMPSVWATTIYKYRDADGILHYTDRRPGAQQPFVEIFSLYGSAPEQQRTVFIEKRGSSAQPQLYVVNQNLAPVEVKFWFTQKENMRALALPERIIVPGKSTQKIADVQPLNANEPPHFDYQMRWQLGDPRAMPSDNVVYSAPVPTQGLFTIAQGFNGSYSHNTDGSRYAIDIGMPIGSAVRAARAGQIVSVQDGYNDGGNSVSYRSQTNSVYVLHDDGTFGVYAHLRHRSALVQPGQRVAVGQILAQSGNTGYSTGPHLHFAVLRNAGLKWQSVPFTVATSNGPVKPLQGTVLSALTPTLRIATRDR